MITVWRKCVFGSGCPITFVALQALPHIAEMRARTLIANRPYVIVAEVPNKANLTGRARHKWNEVAQLVEVRPVEG